MALVQKKKLKEELGRVRKSLLDVVSGVLPVFPFFFLFFSFFSSSVFLFGRDAKLPPSQSGPTWTPDVADSCSSSPPEESASSAKHTTIQIMLSGALQHHSRQSGRFIKEQLVEPNVTPRQS